MTGDVDGHLQRVQRVGVGGEQRLEVAEEGGDVGFQQIVYHHGQLLKAGKVGGDQCHCLGR